MDPLEIQTQSFIVRLWLEEDATAERAAVWRGHITHVPSGARRYVKSLQEISAFIAPYLKLMGVQLAARGWRRRWPNLWRR